MLPFQLIELALRFRYVKNLWNSVIDFFNQVHGLFSTFKIIDAVDILFVAFMLYVILRIIRDTRAMMLIRGIILFAALYLVVTFFGMSASSYILRSVFANILVLLVIIFAPELRNILEEMGKGAARNSFMQILNSGKGVEINEINKCIDYVTKACVEMSDNKIGALIVFEKETLLGDVIETGTVINAKVTKELIENVFFPKAPMHDGAMIIRDAKAYAAGCILPLTRDNDISSSLGTRHRAAIGITQVSDAVVVVVSEETGYISVAENGTLNQNVSSGVLRDILIGKFIPLSSVENASFVKKFARRLNNDEK
ncbi:MAG: diadenylate cyclase CdaA [Eubacterium sp.]|nr:diadenylate cyclase CdaA [Eubacterium sp.]